MAAAAMAALAGLLLAPARAAGPFEIDKDYIVQVDGDPSADAQVFRGDRGLLLEIPSQPTHFFVDASLRTVFAVRKEQIAGSGDRRRLTREQFAWSAPLSYEGPALRFHTGVSEIRLVPDDGKPAERKPARESVAGETAGGGGEAPAPADPDNRKAIEPAPPATEMTATPAVPFTADAAPACGDTSGNAPPVTMPDAAARDCLFLESRPAAGVPGCTRFVFIRNRCGTPVVAQVQRIERLMSGTLPQVFNVAVRREEWLGCAWWSGAMAPARHDILAAAFLETHPRRAAATRPSGR
jgi:hypothetical protein